MNRSAFPLRTPVNGENSPARRRLASDIPRLLATVDPGPGNALVIENGEKTSDGRNRLVVGRSEEALRWLATNAHCLVWYADVAETEGEDLHWDMRIVDEAAAHRFLPLDVKQGQSYGDAWYWSAPEEDRRRSAEIIGRKLRAGEDFTQEFRCRDRDGYLHWLHED